MLEVIKDHGIQEETITSIGQFALLWGMVEDEYFEKCCTDKKLSRVIVVQDTDDIIPFAVALRTALLDYYSSSDEVFRRLCMRKKDMAFSEAIIGFLEEKEQSAPDIILGALCTCFRVRNNMLHGEKIFWIINQQKAIIDACSGFLNGLLIKEDILQLKDA